MGNIYQKCQPLNEHEKAQEEVQSQCSSGTYSFPKHSTAQHNQTDIRNTNHLGLNLQDEEASRYLSVKSP